MTFFCFLQIIQSSPDDFIHIVVFILAQAAAEDHVALLLGQFFILGIERAILGIVDGVVGFHTGLPFGGVFPADDGGGLGAEFKVLVFDDPGVGNLPGGVVHGSVALEIFHRQLFGLKPDAAVLEMAQTVAEEFVDTAGVDDGLRNVRLLCDQIEIVGVQTDLYPCEHLLHHGGVAANGDALVAVVEVVVIVGKPAGQPPDDEGRQILAVPAPLLFGVALDKLGVNIGANQAQSLLLQILRIGDVQLRHLLGDLGLGLGRGADAPHPGEGVHVEGQIVGFIVVDRDGGIDEIVELRKLVNIIPHLFIAGVENVGTVDVNVDVRHLFGIDVAGNVAAAVNHQTAFAFFRQLMGKNSTVKTGTDDQIIILHGGIPFPSKNAYQLI